jgi:carbon-monoxide dehydrogenase small subunit
MILTAHSLLEIDANPTRDDIVDAISANICRCTGYGQIVEAIELAADRLRKTNRPRNLKRSSDTDPAAGPTAGPDAPPAIVTSAMSPPDGGSR